MLLDAGYGDRPRLRMEIGALVLTYVAGILSSTSVWAPARSGCRRNDGRAAVGGRRACALTQSTGRNRPRNSAWLAQRHLVHDRLALRQRRVAIPSRPPA
ncbi:MAG: hypothetical protein ACLQME_19160 [Alphaproteobacteria bacterium]